MTWLVSRTVFQVIINRMLYRTNIASLLYYFLKFCNFLLETPLKIRGNILFFFSSICDLMSTLRLLHPLEDIFLMILKWIYCIKVFINFSFLNRMKLPKIIWLYVCNNFKFIFFVTASVFRGLSGLTTYYIAILQL